MKKTVLAAGGFIVLGIMCYVGASSGQAQQQPSSYPQPAATPAAAAQPRTRIALLNLTYVIKNYDKYKHFQEEIKGIVEPFQKIDTSLRQEMEAMRKQVEDATRDGKTVQREELERRGKEIQRKLEDNSAEIKQKLGARSDEEMRILFMDVYDAAQRYASSHDFELVLHYNDAIERKDFLSSQNIARKLNTGALMPLIFMGSLDISREIVDMLNYNMRQATVPGGGAPPAGTPHQ